MDFDLNKLSVVRVNDPGEADILLDLMRRAMMLYAREAAIPLYNRDGSYTLTALNETRGDLVQSMKEDDFLAVTDGSRWLASLRLVSDPEAGKALLTRFCVDPSFKSRGIGSMLLGVSADYMRERGIRELYLYTARDNTRLLDFYKRHGFRLYSVNRGRPYPRVCMIKEL